MRTRNEGFNTFSNYDTIQFYLDFTSRKSFVESVQLTYGGYAFVNPYSYKIDLRNSRYKAKMLFNEHSKDGYYKEKFLFLDGTPQSMNIIFKGTIFHEVFFYLQEEYDKEFVIEYFKTLFPKINDLHKFNTEVKFVKYENRINNQYA